jgi:hypothetical protein
VCLDVIVHRREHLLGDHGGIDIFRQSIREFRDPVGDLVKLNVFNTTGSFNNPHFIFILHGNFLTHLLEVLASDWNWTSNFGASVWLEQIGIHKIWTFITRLGHWWVAGDEAFTWLADRALLLARWSAVRLIEIRKRYSHL